MRGGMDHPPFLLACGGWIGSDRIVGSFVGVAWRGRRAESSQSVCQSVCLSVCLVLLVGWLVGWSSYIYMTRTSPPPLLL
ncbi:hypothetical protein BC567DRAFT_221569 [Phyllosticta citribraziliensis]